MNEIERLTGRIDADLLRTFLVVADCRNLTHAALALGRTQSAISVQVKKLEASLSVRLFAREARGMSLTEPGERLQSAARPVLRDLERVASMFADVLVGRVRVGIHDEYGSGVLEGILARFVAQHPDVEVEVRSVNSVDIPACITRGELDLAVHANRPDAPLGEPIRTERSAWAAADTWRPRKGAPIPLALYDRACWWREAAITALQAEGRAYRVVVSSESTAGVIAAIVSGLAVGMVARGTISKRMRILGERDGFPKLPDTVPSAPRAPKMATLCTTPPGRSVSRWTFRRGTTGIGSGTPAVRSYCGL